MLLVMAQAACLQEVVAVVVPLLQQQVPVGLEEVALEQFLQQQQQVEQQTQVVVVVPAKQEQQAQAAPAS